MLLQFSIKDRIIQVSKIINEYFTKNIAQNNF